MNDTLQFPGLTADIRSGIALITLREPAYDLDNLGSIARAVRGLETRHDVSALVLRAHGDRFFTGASVPLLEHLCALDADSRNALIVRGQDNVRSLLQTPKLTVAYVDGFAAGGGVDLVLACDLVLATENTRVNLFYSKLGVVPDDGALFLLAERVGWPKALRLCEDSNSWNAQECLALGIADRSVDSKIGDPGWPRTLRRELRLPPTTRAALKRMRWLDIADRLERHLTGVAGAMSELLVMPEQQVLIQRTAAAQRMQSASQAAAEP